MAKEHPYAGKVIVIFFLLCAVAALAYALWSRETGWSEPRFNQASIGLAKIHEAAVEWAKAHDGRYPGHLSVLVEEERLPRERFLDPREFEDTDWSTQPEGNAGWYRYGDYRFARLEEATGDEDIVFGWTAPAPDGRRWMFFDNGRPRRIESEEWDDVWAADAAARAERGLPPISPPP